MDKKEFLQLLSSDDTIAAISTHRGRGAIGIVRVSGPDSMVLAEKTFRSSTGRKTDEIESHHLTHGHLIDPENDGIVDEVLFAPMRSPNSYTGEDMVEVHAHGGVVVLDKVLDVFLSQGARLARPGEFTQRAFLNGRLTLTQAEAIGDLIDAQTETARRLAIKALHGEPARKMQRVREKLSDILVRLEATIDFPTEDIETDGRLEESLEEVSATLASLMDRARERLHHIEGLRTPICGKRNVGKSSLLNRLLGQDRALVTPHPGTTRDTVEEDAVLGEMLIHLVDTAGIGESVDPVEQLGLQRSGEAISQSEIVLFVVDVSQEIDEDDKRVFELLRERFGDDLPDRVLLVANKVDLLEDKANPPSIPPCQGGCPNLLPPLIRGDQGGIFRKEFPHLETLFISAKTGEGMESLCERLASVAAKSESASDKSGVGVNARQKSLLSRAQQSVRQSIDRLKECEPRPELSAEDIRSALDALEELDGVKVCPDVLAEIFSRFCIGK